MKQTKGRSNALETKQFSTHERACELGCNGDMKRQAKLSFAYSYEGRQQAKKPAEIFVGVIPGGKGGGALAAPENVAVNLM